MKQNRLEEQSREARRRNYEVRTEGREVKNEEKILSWKETETEKWGEGIKHLRERRTESDRDDVGRERQGEMTECWHQRASSPSTSLSFHGKSILSGMDSGVNSGQDQQLYCLTATININRQSGNSTLQVSLHSLWASYRVLSCVAVSSRVGPSGFVLTHNVMMKFLEVIL